MVKGLLQLGLDVVEVVELVLVVGEIVGGLGHVLAQVLLLLVQLGQQLILKSFLDTSIISNHTLGVSEKNDLADSFLLYIIYNYYLMKNLIVQASQDSVKLRLFQLTFLNSGRPVSIFLQ